MYGINVVNFSPFLSYALFGGAVAAITVTKHGTISADFWVVGFFVEKSRSRGLSTINRWPTYCTDVICDNLAHFRLFPWTGVFIFFIHAFIC